MKNNLLKSVAAAATASALLFSTVTSFAAATATTVTTYKSGNKVGVTSTITGAPAGKMITYLASSGKNGAVNTEKDIKYIGQKTVPADGNVSFSYDIDGAKVGETVATVRYGSDDAATATDLNNDAARTVVYGALTVSKTNCEVNVDKTNIGNGESATVTVQPKAGYEMKMVSVNGAELSDNTAATYTVPYAKNMEFIAVCGAKATESGTPFVVKLRDVDPLEGETSKGIVCHKADSVENVTYGVYAKTSAGTVLQMGDITDGFYAAVEVDNGGYYAIQIINDNNSSIDLESITLYPAYKEANGKIHYLASPTATSMEEVQ